MKFKVAVIEDQRAIREMIGFVLPCDQYTIVYETGDGQEAVKHTAGYQPDLIILDIVLPGLNGLPLLSRLVKELPRCRFLLFSGYMEAEHIRLALKKGAHGYVSKGGPLSDLLDAVDRVAKGGLYFEGEVARLISESIDSSDAHDPSALSTLTRRELEILKLIAESNSTRTIAQMLGISVKTAENHRTNLMKKLDIHDVASLTRFAIRQGLVECVSIPLSDGEGI